MIEDAGRSHRSRRFLNVGAACVPAVLYFVYVWHYSANVPFSDDWTKAPLVVDGLHGRLDIAAMWSQQYEARLLVPNFVFVVVGHFDRFNLQVVIGLAAASYAASFLLILRLFRRYVARPLTPLPVLSLGLIWFSLADTGNSLWAFQMAWYLAIFFFALMCWFLLAWPDRPRLRVAFAILAAVAGTFSMLHGFVLWPIGVICILWTWEPGRARRAALAVWLGAALVTFAAYSHRYEMHPACGANVNCSAGYAVRHPVHFARFFVALVGYVIPTFGPFGRQYYGFHELLGAALCVAAAFVVVQSLREHRHRNRSPLALILIAFGLLFDLTIILGRGGTHVAGASQSRFTMANIVLVTGLAVYAWAHVPNLRTIHDHTRWRDRLRVLAFAAMACLVVSQVIFTTQSGIVEGRAWHQILETEARVLANRDRIPKSKQVCYLSIFVTNGVFRTLPALEPWFPYIVAMQKEHLYVYEPSTHRQYRAQGPPTVPGVCNLPSATRLTPAHGGD